MKRTSRRPAKRTSRRSFRPHACASDNQGLCHVCGKLMNSDRFHSYTGVESNPRGRIGASKELAVSEGVGFVRDVHPEEQLGFLPPGLASRLSKMAQGVYSYGFGKRGESLRRFPNATLGGALTSTRIAAQKSREFHYLIDNHSGYPVVARIFDQSGRSVYRVEDYASKLKAEPVKVEVKKKRTSRRAAGA